MSLQPVRFAPSIVRRAVRVRGRVQGVGFRPAVFRLARSLDLGGFVRNDSEGVLVEVEGVAEAIATFLERLRTEAPPLAQVASIHSSPCAPVGERTFRIALSAVAGSPRAIVPADVAPCDECLRELFDPRDRRHRYPFINCTGCGPRYTIVRELPYDRAQTTMSRFSLCADCRREYENPSDRRFHAEPNACPVCGPKLRLVVRGEVREEGDRALVEAAALVRAGRIVAVKGVGGFVLACDASNDDGVRALRERKRRPHKPFAVMARDLESAQQVALFDDATRAALVSPARPIVLARVRDTSPLAPSIAPALREIGFFLAPTPLQQLLLHDGPALQVMTSGNASDEPIAKDDDDALARLGAIADAFLVHDRDINTRADDSVVRIIAGEPRPLRRARGFVPESLPLPFDAPPVLAVGGELKNTVCLTRGDEAFVSQHLGDLSQLETHAFFEETIARLEKLLDVRPRVVAHDLHPDYHSTRWAESRGVETFAVQHHHAHVASCLVEHGIVERVIGVAFDGTGCGVDGSLWGGEILDVSLASSRRVAHLRALRLVGGEAAIREPWRLALAALVDAGEPLDLLSRIDDRRLFGARDLLTKEVASPLSTGAGRWFDAVSSLCRVRDAITYEAQAAAELEALCDDDAGSYEVKVDDEIDLRPTIREVASDLRRGVPTSTVAARFHETLARAIARACAHARGQTALRRVALSGGCFQNRRLTERAKHHLERAGFEVLLHRRVPSNDGGLSLGQAAVAAFQLARGRS